MTKVVFVYSQPYDIYIGRGRCPQTGRQGEWGNLYSHKPGSVALYTVLDVRTAVDRHREWLYGMRPESPPNWPELLQRIRRELRNTTLGCWCKTKKNPDALCHGNTLAYVADSEPCDCCARGGLYNGFASGPRLFICPKGCGCHD